MAKRSVKSSASDYATLLQNIKSRLRTAQIRAALSVNTELTLLYWNIGRAIVLRQKDERWGKSVVERLARDLRAEFPDIDGLSQGNIWRMRNFYLAWPPDILAQAARELTAASKLAQPVRESIPSSKLQQPVAEAPPEPLASIPWGHNIILLEKLKDPAVRLWYARSAETNRFQAGKSGVLQRQNYFIQFRLPASPVRHATTENSIKAGIMSHDLQMTKFVDDDVLDTAGRHPH